MEEVQNRISSFVFEDCGDDDLKDSKWSGIKHSLEMASLESLIEYLKIKLNVNNRVKVLLNAISTEIKPDEHKGYNKRV